jgi:hypothetical protein
MTEDELLLDRVLKKHRELLRLESAVGETVSYLRSIKPGDPCSSYHVARRSLFRLGVAEIAAETRERQVAAGMCPDAELPDGPICPLCGGVRAPSGEGGGSWVHKR